MRDAWARSGAQVDFICLRVHEPGAEPVAIAISTFCPTFQNPLVILLREVDEPRQQMRYEGVIANRYTYRACGHSFHVSPTGSVC